MKNSKKNENSFFKKSLAPYEEIHTGAFFPDGKTPVDCISGVKSAFGEHLEKKSCWPISGPPPKPPFGGPEWNTYIFCLIFKNDFFHPPKNFFLHTIIFSMYMIFQTFKDFRVQP